MLMIESASVDAPRHASFAVPASPESVPLARKMTELVTRAWTDPVEDFADTLLLLLSELFTNAVRHGVDPSSRGRARIGVDLVETKTGLHVEVHDPNQGESRGVALSHASAHSESGRGLELVNELASAWGWKYTDTGKFVFFDLDEPGPNQGGGSARQALYLACPEMLPQLEARL
jgi:anti-sigma regulatory factor (Ser/Thr protein kinase)